VADALDEVRFAHLLEQGTERALHTLNGLGAADDGSLASQVGRCLEVRQRLVALATDTGLEVDGLLQAGKRVLLEGAQGTALDLDHGTYPFVTSSNTTAAGAAVGIGVGPTRIDSVLGVVKAYTTRVGNGPFPTEFEAELGTRIRELGHEFGATTGRPRRCGWFDAVLARYAARVNGLTGLAVTKLDVLDTLPEISIAVRYRLPSGDTEHFPADTQRLEETETVLETLPGWQCPTSEARSISDLPKNARRYLDRVEELTGVPVEMVSIGTKRSQVIHAE
jgi:adenylosuccinate synthase